MSYTPYRVIGPKMVPRYWTTELPWLTTIIWLHPISTSRQNLPMVPTSFLPSVDLLPSSHPPAQVSARCQQESWEGGAHPLSSFPIGIISIPGHITGYVPSRCNHLLTPPIYSSQKRDINAHTAVLCTY